MSRPVRSRNLVSPPSASLPQPPLSSYPSSRPPLEPPTPPQSSLPPSSLAPASLPDSSISLPSSPAVAAPKQPLQRRGRKSGSSNWSPEQTDLLLEQVRALLPRGHQEWEKVVQNYNALTGESTDYDRLRDRFFKLVRTVKPTGKNTKPTHVQRAQEISEEIEARVYGGIGDGEDDDGDAIDRAALQLSLASEEEEEKAASASPALSSSSSPLPSRVLPVSSSSSVSPPPRVPPRSFPTERSYKRAKGGDVTEAVQALSTTLSTAIAAQLTLSREEAKLAREQMSMQQQQMSTQLLQQQTQMAQLIIALTGRSGQSGQSG